MQPFQADLVHSAKCEAMHSFNLCCLKPFLSPFKTDLTLVNQCRELTRALPSPCPGVSRPAEGAPAPPRGCVPVCGRRSCSAARKVRVPTVQLRGLSRQHLHIDHWIECDSSPPAGFRRIPVHTWNRNEPV